MSGRVEKRESGTWSGIFRRTHAAHPNCLRDEWLSAPCRLADGSTAPRPIVWSRRNGPWHPVDILWIGAAPGNAGGKGAGNMGAHGTRIPFGGDIAGTNLEVLLGSIGITRNDTFITAALNHLPAAGGGEPTFAELCAPVGLYASSLHLLRDTVLAVHPQLIVALGNVALRALIASGRLHDAGIRLPSQAKLEKAGLERGVAVAWLHTLLPDNEFMQQWADDSPLPAILWLTHPSAQNMSPFARKETLFHARMLEARAALRATVRDHLGWTLLSRRAPTPADGIYAIKEWRELIGPRHEALDKLWREKGV